jgi:hypothetical protein
MHHEGDLLVRDNGELRCQEPDCGAWIWNNPGGEFAGCPKYHGKLYRRLNEAEEAYILRQQIPVATRLYGDIFHVPGCDEPFRIGHQVDRRMISRNSLLAGKTVYAEVDYTVFVMLHADKTVRKAPPVPEMPKQVQSKLALVFD